MQFDKYMEELNAQAAEFQSFIDSAFDTDLRGRLRGSVELARAAGVEEDEILKTIEDVDDFFM